MVDAGDHPHSASPEADISEGLQVDQTNTTSSAGPELVFALVYPVGTDADLIIQKLSEALADVGYSSTPLHLIDLLSEDWRPQEGQDSENVYSRYDARMTKGNSLREVTARRDVFGLYAAARMALDRRKRTGGLPLAGRALSRHAYIIRSLKRPEEVDVLRGIYGDALIVLGAHSRPSYRRDRLTWEIARSDASRGTPDARRPEAEGLIARDEREGGDTFGQRVSDTFPLADVFVDASHPAELSASLSRFVELLFGYQFHTPTRGEFGMFHAFGAALRSADLSRQVGAAIATADGDLISLGTNEVPKAGGGLYGPEDANEDRRDYTYGHDVSTDVKRRALAQLVQRLVDKGWLQNDAIDTEELWDAVGGTDLMNVGEFGRGVHAEMAAIMDAARRGVSVSGATLYTTTFPCHVCARHIVAAGIEKVVYNEPYPKSLARYLHQDSVAVDEDAGGRTVVNLVPFVGVSPRLYISLFRMDHAEWRKTPAGVVAPWRKGEALPRLSGFPPVYLIREAKAAETINELMGNGGAEPGTGQGS